jgi:HlyD family secretion protein
MYAEAGTYISPQAPAAVIYGGDRFMVVTYLRTEDARAASGGGTRLLTLSLNSGDVTAESEISEIDDRAEERMSALGVSERRVRVKVGLAKDALPVRYGYSLDVRFVTGTAVSALAVPKTAVSPTTAAMRSG